MTLKYQAQKERRIRKKMKGWTLRSPFAMTPIVTWMIWKLQISLSCNVQVSEIIEQRRAFAPNYYHMHPCAASPSVWWGGIYCLWGWWKITSVPSTPSSPSIRRSNVALMPWHGEKSDLAPGRGMFLVRLWCMGPGRGHMKGSPCQSAEMFSLKSNEDQSPRTDLRTRMPHIIQEQEQQHRWQAGYSFPALYRLMKWRGRQVCQCCD